MEAKDNKIWKDIPGWEDYQISEYGEVFSKRRKTLIKGWKAPNQYPWISLSKNRVEKTFCIHRLVALAHIPNPDNKRTVNHKDGNKHNNHISNLEWATWSENQIHAITSGLAVVPFLGSGENHPAAKLNNVDIGMIRILLENGFTNDQIAKRFNVHEAHISAIKLNKTWKQAI